MRATPIGRKNPELKGDDGKLLKTHNISDNSRDTKIEIPAYANKRIIGISTIIQELANNYLNLKRLYGATMQRDQLMIYSNLRELRKSIWMKSKDGFYHYLSRKNPPTYTSTKKKDLFRENY
ncbi:hypothetical protein H5410_063179 [Solanum commersonii]|uniref:Uncharacterized protein n=1 Tax=Solanum commersonii TaxID=4109 RepID=A0A9J5WD28_SOLCO|nr:hypothetical protein H5410_063179 [Solanum commersonii]